MGKVKQTLYVQTLAFQTTSSNLFNVHLQHNVRCFTFWVH